MYAALALGLYTSQGERCAQNCDFYGRKKNYWSEGEESWCWRIKLLVIEGCTSPIQCTTTRAAYSGQCRIKISKRSYLKNRLTKRGYFYLVCSKYLCTECSSLWFLKCYSTLVFSGSRQGSICVPHLDYLLGFLQEFFSRSRQESFCVQAHKVFLFASQQSFLMVCIHGLFTWLAALLSRLTGVTPTWCQEELWEAALLWRWQAAWWRKCDGGKGGAQPRRDAE